MTPAGRHLPKGGHSAILSKGRDGLRCRPRHGKAARALRRCAGGERAQRDLWENFVNQAHEAQKVAESENLSELKQFHKRLGSILVLTGKLSPTEGRSDSEFVAQKESDDGGSAAESFFKNRGFFPMWDSGEQDSGPVKKGRRGEPVLCVQYPGPWQILAARDETSNWRGTYQAVRQYFEDNPHD